MILVKRIVTIISCILGASIGIILLATINWAFSLQLSFGNVFIFGLIGGAVAGVTSAYLFTLYLMNKARKFVRDKVGKFNGRYGHMQKIVISKPSH